MNSIWKCSANNNVGEVFLATALLAAGSSPSREMSRY